MYCHQGIHALVKAASRARQQALHEHTSCWRLEVQQCTEPICACLYSPRSSHAVRCDCCSAMRACHCSQCLQTRPDRPKSVHRSAPHYDGCPGGRLPSKSFIWLASPPLHDILDLAGCLCDRQLSCHDTGQSCSCHLQCGR